MELYLILKWLHVLGAAVLFGTGAGIAFFMVWAHYTKSVSVIAAVSRGVVFSDFLFTASAVILQPITGYFLARELGISLFEPWVLVSLVLYLLVGLCWLPVVWLQMKMRDLALDALGNQAELPRLYDRYFAIWFGLGWPAFIGVLTIYWLMVAKPQLW